MEKSNLSPEKSPDKKPERKEFSGRPDRPKSMLYKVQAGDTLSSIAEKFLEDGSKYMEIYEANKELIGDDPNQIKVGQELKIPLK